jgi:hypothetical protein|tara:strand:+ start:8224 stop:8457 length:234 start_codon:yes stop_codon:yes gene_type:complete
MQKDDDHASRIASLEAYSRVQGMTIRELKTDIKAICTGVQNIERDIHAARIAGRVGLGVCLVVGSALGWAIQTAIGR